MRSMTTMGARNRPSSGPGERGQAIILLVGVLTVIFVIAAIVIDFGLWLGERRAVQRAADLAALAASQDLLSDDYAAIASAHEWAKKNGFDPVENPDVEVTVELLCANTLSNPPAGVCTNTNPPGSGPSSCPAGSGCDSLRVEISKRANHLFTSIFGIGDVYAEASAVAGLQFDFAVAGQEPGLVALNTVILLDAGGAMVAAPCNPARDNDGCPIKEARDAANNFVDVLFDGVSGRGQVGYVPYNYCYKPPGGWICVAEANIIGLTTSAAALHAAIDDTSARSMTNTCLPLLRASWMLNGPGAQSGGDAPRSILLLTNGDNNAYVDPNAVYTPAECRPTIASSVEFRWQPCQPAWQQERELDVMTRDMADQLKEQGIEIYVVGLGVCGSEDGRTASDAGYCSGIGDEAHDDVADQRLLKCIVSSPDHYFPVSSAQDLPETFQEIAGGIVQGAARRGLLQ